MASKCKTTSLKSNHIRLFLSCPVSRWHVSNLSKTLTNVAFIDYSFTIDGFTMETLCKTTRNKSIQDFYDHLQY